MKRLILFELIILFFATTFQSDSPPGWFQQPLPVSDFINDIFFLDSSTGWVCTAGASSSSDTGYVMKTTNGGNNWLVQFQSIASFNAIQFVDFSTGYSVGTTGLGKVYKTTNGGTNWSIQFNFSANPILDLSFVNKDTGWVCSDDPFSGGLYKTINGGVNWQSQLGASSLPKKLFFLNKDTGWTICQSTKILKTTNGGINWIQQNDFPQQRNDVFFRNGSLGWASGPAITYKTTDGGATWLTSNDGGVKLSFANDSVGYAGNNFNFIMKTTTGGQNWFRQSSPIFNAFSTDTKDTHLAWAGGSGLVHTTDGGGPPVGIEQISSEIPKQYSLLQNYPNPFNPTTNIKYQIVNSNSHILLSVYDITGRHIINIVDHKQSAGTYKVDFDASYLPSGVYFYSLYADGIIIDTKKMLMVK